MFGREPVVFMALLRAEIVLGVSFGLKLTDEQTLAIYGLAEAALAFVTRSKVSPTTKSGGGGGKMATAAIVLTGALVLSGCGLFQRATAMFADQYERWGPEYEEVVRIVCGVAESNARDIGYKDARDLFCMSRQQLEPYAEEATGMLQRAEAGAVGRMRSE